MMKKTVYEDLEEKGIDSNILRFTKTIRWERSNYSKIGVQTREVGKIKLITSQSRFWGGQYE